MPVRSVRGLLLTLLIVCAVIALGLNAVRPTTPPRWADSPGGVAWLLSGWRLASVTLALGLGVWIGGAGIEAVGGTRAARWAAVLMISASPWIAAEAAHVYWAPRLYVSVWRVDGDSPDQRAGLWRGILGGSCGYGSVIGVQFGADGRGRGRAVPMYLGGYKATAALIASPLTGPLAIPVEAVLRDGEMTVWSATDTLGTAQVIAP